MRQWRHAHRPRSRKQLGLRPARAAVDRDVDPGDVPIAARKRVTTRLDRPGGDGGPVARGEDIGVQRHQAERHPDSRARVPSAGTSRYTTC